MAGQRRILFYAALCFRLALRREAEPLAALGLAGVQSRERLTGAGASRAYPGRFDSPGFPVLYVAETVETCAAEIGHHLKTHYLDYRHGLHPQDFAYTLLEVPIAGAFDDLRGRRDAPKGLVSPSGAACAPARRYAARACRDGLDGLICGSPRHRGGTCVARFLTPGLAIPTRPVGQVRFHWTGKRLLSATTRTDIGA